jgi:excisionase family DNA binding protein
MAGGSLNQRFKPDSADLQSLYDQLRSGGAKLVGSDGRLDPLPSNLQSLLYRLVNDLKSGRAVNLLQEDAELTTVKAARLLAVSRQFLIGLLNQDQIPYHMVGTHRRLYARDVFAYKSMRDSARRKTLDDLARAEYEEGIYDRVPFTGEGDSKGQ